MYGETSGTMRSSSHVNLTCRHDFGLLEAAYAGMLAKGAMLDRHTIGQVRDASEAATELTHAQGFVVADRSRRAARCGARKWRR